MDINLVCWVHKYFLVWKRTEFGIIVEIYLLPRLCSEVVLGLYPIELLIWIKFLGRFEG